MDPNFFYAVLHPGEKPPPGKKPKENVPTPVEKPPPEKKPKEDVSVPVEKPKEDVPLVDVVSLQNQLTTLQTENKSLGDRVAELTQKNSEFRRLISPYKEINEVSTDLHGDNLKRVINRNTVLMKFIPVEIEDDFSHIVDELRKRMGTDSVIEHLDKMTGVPEVPTLSSEPRFDLSRFALEEPK